MSGIDRRSFLHSLGVLLPAATLLPSGEVTAAQPAQAPLDSTLLRALAEVALPSELGPEGVERAAADFQAWTEGFEPVAEVNHGYGTGELEYTGADPAPGWAAQLRALDTEARRRLGRGFAELPAVERQELVRAQLARSRQDRIPVPGDATHVAVGLIAWYYATPEATDLCYRAEIGKNQCRPLATAPQKPAPLQPGA